MASTDIPDDFPCGPNVGAVPGAQPKLLLRKIGDAYISGWTDQERAERYQVCSDLVAQLVPYARRKLKTNPTWDVSDFSRDLAAGIRAKPWGLTEVEIDWVVQRTC